MCYKVLFSKLFHPFWLNIFIAMQEKMHFMLQTVCPFPLGSKRRQLWLQLVSFGGRGTRTWCFSYKEALGVASVEPGSRSCPPDRGIQFFKSFSTQKKPTADAVGFFLAGALGLEPRAYGFGVSNAILTIFLQLFTAFISCAFQTQNLAHIFRRALPLHSFNGQITDKIHP